MSLGDFTKCDLSAGIAKIDREILIKTLQTTVAMLSNKLRSELSYSTGGYYGPKEIYDLAKNIIVSGNSMLGRVETLIKACEVLHTVSESVKREEIIFED
jgi:hypothetical protein